MAETDKKSKRSFWIIFLVLVALAAIGTLGNLHEFSNMNKLDTEGKRILCPVDSATKSGSKQEIFTHFTINGKIYNSSKKIKSIKASGDTVAVYYLEHQPEVNRIEVE